VRGTLFKKSGSLCDEKVRLAEVDFLKVGSALQKLVKVSPTSRKVSKSSSVCTKYYEPTSSPSHIFLPHPRYLLSINRRGHFQKKSKFADRPAMLHASTTLPTTSTVVTTPDGNALRLTHNLIPYENFFVPQPIQDPQKI
jgi:hypothetical protein